MARTLNGLRVVVATVGVLYLSPIVLAQSNGLLDLYDRARLSRGAVSGERLQTLNLINTRNRQQTDLFSNQSFTFPLEGSVDPDEYVVGPNDVFEVSLFLDGPALVPLSVSAEGNLQIPGARSINVAGLTLRKAHTAIQEVLAEAYENTPVEVSLMQPRQFYVHVTGAVPEPGRYHVYPVSRVEDVLKKAYFLLDYDPGLSNYTFRPSLRNVEIRRLDGSAESLDLVKYYRTGDISQNPYLQDGDIVHIPTFQLDENTVYIDGDVAFPGTYDLRPGDTVADLLVIGNGDDKIDDVASVRVVSGATGRVSSNYSADEIRQSASGMVLHPLDHVNVRRTSRINGTAEADGHVEYPGNYPIRIGESTLTDLLEMAGGFREDALVNGAYLDRLTDEERSLRDLPVSEAERLLGRPTGPYQFLTDTSDILQQMRLGDLDFLSRYYLARSLRTETRVAVDVARAIDEDADPVLLQDGDRLVVPRDEQTVRVLGQVVRPGAVDFRAATNIDYYLRAAGGQSPTAGPVYVIKAGTGQILLSGDASIESGDVVFVDSAEDLSITTDQERLALQLRDDRRRNAQFWFGAVTSVVSVVVSAVTIVTLIDRLGN